MATCVFKVHSPRLPHNSETDLAFPMQPTYHVVFASQKLRLYESQRLPIRLRLDPVAVELVLRSTQATLVEVSNGVSHPVGDFVSAHHLVQTAQRRFSAAPLGQSVLPMLGTAARNRNLLSTHGSEAP